MINVKPLMEKHITIKRYELNVFACSFMTKKNTIFIRLSMYDRKEFVKPLVKKGSRRLISTNDTIQLHRVNELTSSLNNIRILMDASNSCV